MIKRSNFNLSDTILFNAERKVYGLKQFKLKGDIGEDEESLYALQSWELTCNLSLYLTTARQKEIQAEKSRNNKISTKARILDRVLALIDKIKKEKDLPKLQSEYQKYELQIQKEIQ